VAALTCNRPAPGVIRWISGATLTLFLYHNLFQVMLRPHVLSLPPAGRILLSAAVGFIGAATVALAGRRLFRGWSRVIIGA
jgi:hypothetical protein